MSYLMRNGTGRNNIVWGGGTTTSANYLRRTGTSLNSISFINISSNGTYNILERYSTSRNSIRWNNIVFSFANFSTYKLNYYEKYDTGYNLELFPYDSDDSRRSAYGFYVNRYLSNGYQGWTTGTSTGYNDRESSITDTSDALIRLYTNNISGLYNLISSYTKITITVDTSSGSTVTGTYNISKRATSSYPVNLIELAMENSRGALLNCWSTSTIIFS